MKNSKRPFLPLTRVAQGQLLESFESAFDDKASVSYRSFFLMCISIAHVINISPCRLEVTYKTKETV